MDAVSKVAGNPETALEAASREAFEEVGLRVGVDIVPIAAMSDDAAVKYEAGGWLKQAGFAGQQLHWVLFACCNAVGDVDAAAMCDLGGHGGEAAEFSAVRWQSFEDVIEGMWPAKRAPYEALRRWAEPLLADHWQAAAARVDFSGRWARDVQRHLNVVDALITRGHDSATAEAEAAAPYVQQWERLARAGDYRVTTFAADGVTARRTLDYVHGEWVETFTGGAVIFGPGSGGGTLRRRTAWLPLTAADAEPQSQSAQGAGALALAAPTHVAHATWTSPQVNGVGHDGTGSPTEISIRFLRKGGMVLRRILVQPPEEDGKAPAVVVSEEFFRKEECE